MGAVFCVKYHLRILLVRPSHVHSMPAPYGKQRRDITSGFTLPVCLFHYILPVFTSNTCTFSSFTGYCGFPLLTFAICCLWWIHTFLFQPWSVQSPVDSKVEVADRYVTFARKSRAVLATANPPTVQLALLRSYFDPALPCNCPLQLPQVQPLLFTFEEHLSHFLSSLDIVFKFCCALTISKLELFELHIFNPPAGLRGNESSNLETGISNLISPNTNVPGYVESSRSSPTIFDRPSQKGFLRRKEKEVRGIGQCGATVCGHWWAFGGERDGSGRPTSSDCDPSSCHTHSPDTCHPPHPRAICRLLKW